MPIRNSKNGDVAYRKLKLLNYLDIKFYDEAKRIGSEILSKYSVNISDPKCLAPTYSLPKQVEHLRYRIDEILRSKEYLAARKYPTGRVIASGNSTATNERLCLASSRKRYRHQQKR